MSDDRDGAPSEFEVAGRANVVGYLARYIQRMGLSVETISTWGPNEWLEAAKGAEISSALKSNKVPSDKTQGQVIGLLTPAPSSR